MKKGKEIVGNKNVQNIKKNGKVFEKSAKMGKKMFKFDKVFFI